MDQNKIGQLIKDLRIKSNLTQAQFADKYGVTYQAVSKWENGKNLPDTLLLKQICNDYNINIDDILDGKITKSKSNLKWLYIVIPIIVLIIISIIIMAKPKNNPNFEFRTISSTCDDFKINGSIAYNNTKSVIYISDIEYCGTNENEIYKEISCNLYEKNGTTSNLIANCNVFKNTNVSIKDYLKNVNININNYQKLCKDYTNDSLYLEIKAINKENKTISYSIPLSVKEC